MATVFFTGHCWAKVNRIGDLPGSRSPGFGPWLEACLSLPKWLKFFNHSWSGSWCGLLRDIPAAGQAIFCLVAVMAAFIFSLVLFVGRLGCAKFYRQFKLVVF